MKIYTAIGTMSGTSMDSIDVALLKTDGRYVIEAIAHHALPYPLWFHTLLKAAEYAVRQQEGNIAQASLHFMPLLNDFLYHELQLNSQQVILKKQQLSTEFWENTQRGLSLAHIIDYSTDLHCLAIQQLLAKTSYHSEHIDVIGYHGQTLFHKPSAHITLQVGEGQTLANALGIAVVNDFRQNDISHGGQGAPFAPLYHQALAIRDQLTPCAVINCGGVANITIVQGQQAKDLLSFDIGPGNGLIDRFVKQRTQGKQVMDKDGLFGLQGQVNLAVLEQLRREALLTEAGINFLTLPPPKSLDIGDFKLLAIFDSLSIEDGCKTLAAFTVDCIIHALQLIHLMKPEWPLFPRLILAGGGEYNPVIQQELTDRLSQQAITLLTTEAIGWHNKALEAQIFAYLAVRSLQQQPISFPETTGVLYPLSGGTLYYPNVQCSS